MQSVQNTVNTLTPKLDIIASDRSDAECTLYDDIYTTLQSRDYGMATTVGEKRAVEMASATL